MYFSVPGYQEINPIQTNIPDYNAREVVKILIHPSYNKTNHLGDIAIIRLNNVVPMASLCYYSFVNRSASEIAYAQPFLKRSSTGTFLWNFGPSDVDLQSKNTVPYAILNQVTYYGAETAHCPPKNGST